MPEFKCKECSITFELPQSVIDKYPNWQPQYCRRHTPSKKKSASANQANKSVVNSRSIEENLTTSEVLAKYSDGPDTGIFTDGSARPNPGPGGWGLVWVKAGQIIKELYGHEEATTNNRMELTALINAYSLLNEESVEVIYTDSELCINILTKWAKNWKARGWKKKDGAIKNLELVQKLYELYQSHPKVTLTWVKAHNGWRWNEYADALASAWSRDT